MLFPEYHNRFRYISHVSLRKWVLINQQEFFLLSISKKKTQKNERALHVQLCSDFTTLLHVHHGITGVCGGLVHTVRDLTGGGLGGVDS